MPVDLERRERQATYLAALEDSGSVRYACRRAGITYEGVAGWRKDRDFADLEAEKRASWGEGVGDQAVNLAIELAFHGWEEDVIHQGRRAYEVEIDPDALAKGKRKLRFKLDEENRLIPLKVRKRDPKMLRDILGRFAGWDSDEGYADLSKGIDIRLTDGTVLDLMEVLRRALGASEARVVDLEHPESLPEHGEHHHHNGQGRSPGEPDRPPGS